MGEVTVCSSLRGVCSPAAVAGMAGAGAARTTGPGATLACTPERGWRLMRTDSSPSDISSSEMPDSSSSSINFFTLRISIRGPPSIIVFDFGQTRACGLERELIADRAQSKYAADRHVG